MKPVFVLTLGDIIGLSLFALVIVIGIIVGVTCWIRSAFCKHAELWPPATSFGGPGHGWQCKKCRKDFGWGDRPPTAGDKP